ncbi:MAG: DUF1444 family protein [Woeseiaceae bacterium]|nr:DUF1444 family protein [Woeseiaceae bacterium]
MSIAEAIAYLKTEVPEDDAGETILVRDDEFPAHSSLGNGLTCFYLLDRGERFEYVMSGQLQEHAETIESLHGQAVANLASLAESNLVVRSYQDIFVALVGGNFEASLLLVDDLWDETYSHVVKNDFVAVIPQRDILAFCDSESEVGKAQLVETIARIWPSEDHPLSDKLYRRVDRQWEVYSDGLEH